MEQWYDLAEEYAQKIMDSPDFKRLLELKECIKKTLSGKIIAFKTAEAKYLEAKEYGSFHPNLKEYQKLFVEKKKSLYQEEAIQEYQRLERKIQQKLNADLDDLKKSISNKFHLTAQHGFGL